MDRIIRAVAEPVDIGVEFVGSLFHLAASHDAERAEPFRSERILPAFAARRAGDDDAHAEAEAQIGEQAVMLVIGMRAGIHHGDGRGQAGQGPVQPRERKAPLLFLNTISIGQHGSSIGADRRRAS